MGLGRAITLFFAVQISGFIKHRTALRIFYSISKKVTALRWKEALMGLCSRAQRQKSFLSVHMQR